MDKQQVIDKLKEQLEYINELDKLKKFWNTHNTIIEKITAHYFSFSNSNQYQTNKQHYDSKVKEIICIDINQIKTKLESLIFDLENSDSAENYIELLYKQLASNEYFSHYFTRLKELNNFNEKMNIDNITNDISSTEVNHKIFDYFSNNINSYITTNLKSLSQTLSNVELFDLLKDKDENLILIGANGSGKSTFSRQIKQNLTSNFSSFVAVIPAQKTFNVPKNDSIPLKTQAYSKFSKSHIQDKLFKNNNDSRYAHNEFSEMVNYLIAEHQEVANKTHQNYENTDFQKENSILENVIDIWQTIITHIQLNYDGQGNIKVIPQNGNEYDFMGLSDGEKNIFYCIASVLTVSENGYVIVDEPENHLNMSIVNKLWDRLEDVRSDCQFVYLTHNPSFAIGRAGAKILWIKKYTPPSLWEYEEVEMDNTLPDQLMVELIGSKKKILFCEGERNSYDYQLYSILFKSYTIIPAGGHQKAIDYCKAFNENGQLSSLSAIAIIDKDFYEDEEISAWKSNNIYTLDVMEVENILCDNAILTHIKSRVQASDDDYNNAKEQIFKHIKDTKSKQALEYAKFKTDKVLGSLVGKANTSSQLKDKLESDIKTLNPVEFERLHSELLEAICTEKDYDKALKHYNNKGMLGFVGNEILRGYRDRVIKFIRADEELQRTIVTKYFCDIP